MSKNIKYAVTGGLAGAVNGLFGAGGGMVLVPLLIRAVGWGGFWLILMGGVCYTVGAVLYGLGRTQKYMHSVFHLFVIAGSVLHLLAILLYAL